VTLKQLEAFYWAATCASFAIAASRLNISVSSLSKRISELEVSLGTELFNRSGRAASLTTVGQQLLPHARDLLSHAGRFLSLAKSNSALEGRCRFGAGELTGLTWLPRLVEELQQAHPLLLVEPSVGVGQVIEERLAEGDLDFALIAGPSTRTSISSQIIGQAEFVWVSRPDLLAATDPAKLQPQKLVDTVLISLPATAGTVRILDDWLADHQVSPGRLLPCENWGAIAGLIVQGLGVGFLPKAWAQALVSRGLLVELPKFPPLRPLQYTFQWRRDDNRALIEQCRLIASESIDFHAPVTLL
jgi:DNA-binding transcriptional LysR family regulator